MSSIGFGSPLRPKFHNAKKFLSLQVSQTSQAISSELNSMIKTQTMARKRKKVVNEIFTTEQTYQQHLHLITSVFLAPLQVAALIPKHAESVIFSNIEAIQAVNRELLSHMETQSLGDTFLALAPFLKLYSTYANNFEQACSVLQEWERKSSEFLYFRQQQESKPECKGLTLRALLITPVQRIPRYKMLLESLLNKTPRDHPDFQKLQEATEEISNVANHINENIRQKENFQKMLSIQNSLTGVGAPKIIAPGRMFLKEGPLLKVCSRGSQERMFFLFSDMLIYAKRNGSVDKDQCTYTCRKVLPLASCQLEQVFGNTKATDAGALFKVTCKDKSLLLYSRSQVEAVSWITEIVQAISTLQKSMASLKRVESGECALGERSSSARKSALIRSKWAKQQKPQAIIRKDSDYLSCSAASPSVCLKDSLYPLRKELLVKQRVTEAKALTPGQHMYIPGKGKCIIVGETTEDSSSGNNSNQVPEESHGACHAFDVQGNHNSSSNDKGSFSQYSFDTIEPHGSPSSSCSSESRGSPCHSSGAEMSITSGSMNSSDKSSEDEQGTENMEPNGVLTIPLKKRKVAFNENETMVLSPAGVPINKCFRPSLNFACVQATHSPLSDVGNKMNKTPSRRKKRHQEIKDHPLEETSNCAVM